MPVTATPRLQPRHLALLVLIQSIWGINWIATKSAVDEFQPLLLTGLRFALLFGCMFPFLRWHHGQMRNLVLGCLMTGPFSMAAGFVGLAMAKDIAPLAVASNLGAPFATLLSALFLGDRIGRWRGAALLLSFGGVVFMGFDPKILADATAMMLTAISALFWAIAAIFLRRVNGVGAAGTQAWVSLMTFPPMLLGSLYFEANPLTVITHVSWWAWSSLAMIVVGATIIGHTGFFYLLSRYPIPLMAPFLLLAPVIGAFSGVYWFGNALTWRLLAGGAMTLAGVLIITIREGRRRPEPMPAAEPVDVR